MVVENKYERVCQYYNGHSYSEEKIVSGVIEKKNNTIKKKEKKVDDIFVFHVKRFCDLNSDKYLYNELLDIQKFCDSNRINFAASVTQVLREIKWTEEKQKIDSKRIIRLAAYHNNMDCKYIDIPYYSDEIVLKRELYNSVKEIIDDFSAQRTAITSSKMNVILAPRAAAYFVHEIIGHPLELDLMDKETSFYHTKDVGKTIMPSFFNVAELPEDTAELGIEYGKYDDEGNELHNLEIIKDGVLVNPITYKRCNDFKNSSNFRMHNMILKPNKSGDDLDKIVKKYNKALVIDDVLYGHYNNVNGKYMLYCGRGRLYESGEVIGHTYGLCIEDKLQLLKDKIVELGCDYIGMLGECSKNRQILTVGMGAPTVVLSEIEVLGGK